MNEKNVLATKPAEHKLVITRIINMARELLFQAWTDPRKVAKWWGPKDFTNPVCELDARPGGAMRIDMRGPDGTVYPMSGVYREILENERLVFTCSPLDEKGNPLFEVLNTVTFSDHEGSTKLTVHASVSKVTAGAEPYLAGMDEGWNQSLDRLEALSAEEPLVIERSFDAPVETVWKAITDKVQMKEWYFDLPEFKPEVGFEFRFSAGKDEKKYLHLCKITEVITNKKLAYSWRYDGYEGNSFVTFELFAQGNKTRLRLTHEGLETFPKSNPDLAKENFFQGWTSIIGTSLKEFLTKK
jgi:uncharacterized protein YndB with AHSA1/START domain